MPSHHKRHSSLMVPSDHKLMMPSEAPLRNFLRNAKQVTSKSVSSHKLLRQKEQHHSKQILQNRFSTQHTKYLEKSWSSGLLWQNCVTPHQNPSPTNPSTPFALQLLGLLPAKVTGAAGFSTAPIEAGLHLQQGSLYYQPNNALL